VWLLYLDESGNAAQHENFVLAGVAVFEGQIYNITQSLDGVVAQVFPDATEPIELHVRDVKELCFGEKRKYNRETFYQFTDSMAQVVRDSRDGGLVLFGTVVHIPSLDTGTDPYIAAFEDICGRFNEFLRIKHLRGDTQKGLVIMDVSCQQENIRRQAAQFKAFGNRWGRFLGNLPEVPLFVESDACRLVQLADFVAHALFRRYESGEARDLDKILIRFNRDEQTGIIHGIGHIIANRYQCMCEACISRFGKQRDM